MLEFASDAIGRLTALEKDFAGGILDLTVRAHPDGTQDFSGRDMGFSGRFPRLMFGTGPAFVQLESSGAPTDTGVVAFGLPFDLSSTDGQLLSGTAEIDLFVP